MTSTQSSSDEPRQLASHCSCRLPPGRKILLLRRRGPRAAGTLGAAPNAVKSSVRRSAVMKNRTPSGGPSTTANEQLHVRGRRRHRSSNDDSVPCQLASNRNPRTPVLSNAGGRIRKTAGNAKDDDRHSPAGHRSCGWRQFARGVARRQLPGRRGWPDNAGWGRPFGRPQHHMSIFLLHPAAQAGVFNRIAYRPSGERRRRSISNAEPDSNIAPATIKNPTTEEPVKATRPSNPLLDADAVGLGACPSGWPSGPVV